MALNSTKGREWRYADTEIEFGEFLKIYAEKLLDAQPENYHEALQSLLSATGSTKRFMPV
jgi:hypothetical protein